MPESDLTLLIDAAREAGRIATSYSGKDARRWDKPGDGGPVTEADMAVNTMLEQHLQAARPGYGWLSEETEDNSDRLSCRTVFIVDPIDGTRSYIEGADTWAHALAIATDGIVKAAVIYLPMRDLMYVASAGQGAFLNDAPITPSALTSLKGADILASRPAMDAQYWNHGDVPGFKRSFRPSLAYRMALVAEGRFDGMLTLRPSWEWDIAAGDLILQEAGAQVTDRRGGPLRFNNPHPKVNGVVAGGGSVHQQICAALTPAEFAPL